MPRPPPDLPHLTSMETRSCLTRFSNTLSLQRLTTTGKSWCNTRDLEPLPITIGNIRATVSRAATTLCGGKMKIIDRLPARGQALTDPVSIRIYLDGIGPPSRAPACTEALAARSPSHLRAAFLNPDSITPPHAAASVHTNRSLLLSRGLTGWSSRIECMWSSCLLYSPGGSTRRA